MCDTTNKSVTEKPKRNETNEKNRTKMSKKRNIIMYKYCILLQFKEPKVTQQSNGFFHTNNFFSWFYRYLLFGRVGCPWVTSEVLGKGLINGQWNHRFCLNENFSWLHSHNPKIHITQGRTTNIKSFLLSVVFLVLGFLFLSLLYTFE